MIYTFVLRIQRISVVIAGSLALRVLNIIGRCKNSKGCKWKKLNAKRPRPKIHPDGVTMTTKPMKSLLNWMLQNCDLR